MIVSHAARDRDPWLVDVRLSSDVAGLLELAGRLKRSATAGAEAAMPLAGKNVAVVCDRAAGLASPFARAAAGLGARVAHVRPLRAGSDDGPRAARLLGRLYDAIDCEGLDESAVREIDRESGVPVFSGLSADDHPARVLAVLLALESRSGRPLSSLCVAFIGDACAPRAEALLSAAAQTGLSLRIAPASDDAAVTERVARANALGRRNGRTLIVASADDATRGADVVLSDATLVATPEDLHVTLQALLLRALA